MFQKWFDLSIIEQFKFKKIIVIIDKCTVVTGCTDGIGKAYAEQVIK